MSNFQFAAFAKATNYTSEVACVVSFPSVLPPARSKLTISARTPVLPQGEKANWGFVQKQFITAEQQEMLDDRKAKHLVVSSVTDQLCATRPDPACQDGIAEHWQMMPGGSWKTPEGLLGPSSDASPVCARATP